MPENMEIFNYDAEILELVTAQNEYEKDLQETQSEIYRVEGDYLEETNKYGNILNGWDKYLNSNTFSTKDKINAGKPYKVGESDRLFSSSSVNYKSSISQKKINQAEDAASSKQLCKNELISVKQKPKIDPSEATDVTKSLSSHLPGTKIKKLKQKHPIKEVLPPVKKS